LRVGAGLQWTTSTCAAGGEVGLMLSPDGLFRATHPLSQNTVVSTR
jgi:hypothetical protein